MEFDFFILFLVYYCSRDYMLKKHRKYYNIIFLFTFLAVTLSINFLHTEKTLIENDNCPACKFLNSSFTTSQINFFHLPQFLLLDRLKIFESFNYQQIFFIHPNSRDPPQS